MPLIKSGGVTYSYRRQGTGPSLVLLHGFTASSLDWSDLAGSLSPHMDVVAIDLLGHGQTDSPASPQRYAMEHVARDVLGIIEQLGINRFSLLGYSMGGRLALYLAHRYPALINRLVLESASPGLALAEERRQRLERDAALAGRIEAEGLANFVDHWERLPLFASQRGVPQQKRADLRNRRLQNNPRGLANSLRGMGTGSQPPLWSALSDIALSSLLICGALDEKFVQINEQMAGAMRNGRLKIVDGAGHNIHFEQPRCYAAIVSEFLQLPR